MKYIELFGGIGGFSYGIGKKGECVGYYEIDKYAVQTYNKNFKTNWKPTDITKLHAKDTPKHELLCAGFPCQSFSIAGKRKGFEDTRGTLFFDICRITAFHRTPLLFLENVKGLLSHDEGLTFRTILKTLSELGYSLEWQVLNSKHFGVPQNRERVFIIGHLGGFGGKQVFPLQEVGGGTLEQLNEPIHSTNRLYNPQGIARSIRSQAGGKGAKTGLYAIPVLTPDRPKKRQHGRRFKEDGEPSFTLTGQDIHGVMKENKIRRLTPIECERLQGFPDNWTEGVSDTQRYKQLGNAVTVNVIEAIIESFITKNEMP